MQNKFFQTFLLSFGGIKVHCLFATAILVIGGGANANASAWKCICSHADTKVQAGIITLYHDDTPGNTWASNACQQQIDACKTAPGCDGYCPSGSANGW